MLARILFPIFLFFLGVLAVDRPSSNTRSKGNPTVPGLPPPKKAAPAGPTLNKGGHPTTGGLKPKRTRSLDELVRRAFADVYLDKALYGRGIYDDDVYARSVYGDEVVARDAEPEAEADAGEDYFDLYY